MVAIPSTRYWAPQENPTAADMNAYYRDPFTFLRSSSPLCRLALTTATHSVAHATQHLITGWGEIDDNDSMHSTSTNTGRIVFNTAGVYEISARVVWPGFSTNAQSGYEWGLFIALNTTLTADGSAISASTIMEDNRLQTAFADSGSTEVMSYGFTDYIVTNGGGADQITMWVYQNTTGVAANLTGNTTTTRKGACATSLTARWVGKV